MRGFGTPLLIIAVCVAIIYLIAVRVVGDVDELPLLVVASAGHAQA